MTKLKPGSYFLLLVMAVTLAMFIRSISFDHRMTKLLPMMISGIVFILGAIELARELRGKGKAGETHEPTEPPAGSNTGTEVESKAGLRPYMYFSAWIAGFFFAAYLFSFLVAIPLFLITYFKSHGGGWLASITLTGLTTAFCWAMFDWFLKVSLTQGILLQW